MDKNVQKLTKILESLTSQIEQNLSQFTKATTQDEKRAVAEIMQYLSATQKNTAEVLEILTCDQCEEVDEEMDDDAFDIDSFDDKPSRGRSRGKRGKLDEDLPF
jgi:flagellar motor switch protein FliG